MEAERHAMVETQLRAGGIGDERVLDAMGRVPREEFVPEELREHAYVDGALPIGHGQTISQPWVVAAICSALELRGGERVLDVGGGAGYSTAVIAELVRPGGHVRSYELVRGAGYPSRRRRSLASATRRRRCGRATAPRRTGERWDAIAVHAAAPEVPAPLDRIPQARAGGWWSRSPAAEPTS